MPTRSPGVYASLWQGDGLRLWTLVNRSEQDGRRHAARRYRTSRASAYFDLDRRPRGELWQRRRANARSMVASRPRGIGAFLAGSRTALGVRTSTDFLAVQAAICTRRRLESIDDSGRAGSCGPSSAPTMTSAHEVPEGMVAIPAVHVRMPTQYRNRECGFYQVPGPEVRGPAESRPAPDRPLRARGPADALRHRPDARNQCRSTREFLRQTGYKPAHPTRTS